MSYHLFLDDYRMPDYVAEYIIPVELRTIYTSYKWVVVRSYEEFVVCIEQQGLPGVVSFDYDLAEEHYKYARLHQEISYPDYNVMGNFKVKTGYDCAKWLLGYLERNQLPCPIIYCHSMNVLGKAGILGLFSKQRIR